MSRVVNCFIAPCEVYCWIERGERWYRDLSGAEEYEETHDGCGPHHENILCDRSLPQLFRGTQGSERDGKAHSGGERRVVGPNITNAGQKQLQPREGGCVTSVREAK